MCVCVHVCRHVWVCAVHMCMSTCPCTCKRTCVGRFIPFSTRLFSIPACNPGACLVEPASVSRCPGGSSSLGSAAPDSAWSLSAAHGSPEDARTPPQLQSVAGSTFSMTGPYEAPWTQQATRGHQAPTCLTWARAASAGSSIPLEAQGVWALPSRQWWPGVGWAPANADQAAPSQVEGPTGPDVGGGPLAPTTPSAPNPLCRLESVGFDGASVSRHREVV